MTSLFLTRSYLRSLGSLMRETAQQKRHENEDAFDVRLPAVLQEAGLTMESVGRFKGAPRAPLLEETEIRLVTVLDFETTGLSAKSDRVIEVGLVKVDLQQEKIIDKWDTLVNPQRDVGPTHIHGITGTDVETAPLSGDVYPEMVRFMNGTELMAYNSAFDRRFLVAEIDRIDPDTDVSLTFACLMDLATRVNGFKGRLGDSMDLAGVARSGEAHTALSDAHGAAQLLLYLHKETEVLFRGDTFNAPVSQREGAVYTLRRTSGSRGVPDPSYSGVLDRTLDDLVITQSEWKELDHIADQAGLTSEDRELAHFEWFKGLLEAVRRDGILTTAEQKSVSEAAHALGIPKEAYEDELVGLRQYQAEYLNLDDFERIAFTGDHATWEREDLEEKARRRGL